MDGEEVVDVLALDGEVVGVGGGGAEGVDGGDEVQEVLVVRGREGEDGLEEGGVGDHALDGEEEVGAEVLGVAGGEGALLEPEGEGAVGLEAVSYTHLRAHET